MPSIGDRSETGRAADRAGTKPVVPAPDPPALDTRSLFARGNEVLIVHEGETYHLRLTRQNKLILTK